MATSAVADEIEAALSAVAEKLEANDVVQAAASVTALLAACQATEGGRLSADQVQRLRRLLERCTDLASTAEVKLNVALQKFSVGGRARRAYGDR